ncbi:MAG: Type 4 prepilin-like protein leader peptide-processing enzyme [Candidatus Uhrbacteria bacterium GW2011_GWE2_45_35]|uniref:Type 4 prepilin-like protein leader peptide-processing enzyme n=2 Tax=Candidatus Uhriibacteriota TaxID=1752732 RepID=A0A0G1J951_9BACT|nr:MAG: Type 4 prepilin-like protein leader peptide-processing enzyme [Candidatus Uhrbacteria bacterium GW2011_GWF2_44_350]KKU08912.1 MAG: Type 4 prepilin-like protein leader peptide-processing enzyme [Candidatus Uhrbacteria bacterium GW2011_GWE2_45_35]
MPTIFLLFILGLCFGSFLSATASRAGGKKTNWCDRSACPNCQRKLTATDLVPVLSFVFLKGCCRTCHQPIGWREPIVELATALVFLTVGIIHHGAVDWFLIRDLILTFFLILLFLTDIYHGLLPHRFTATATVVTIGLNLGVQMFGAQNFVPLPEMVLGMLVCGGFFYLQYLISRGRWVGGGDIGLGLFLGAALGWWYGLWTLGLAYILGAMVAIILLATKKMTVKSTIPFGPFLTIAGWLVLLFMAR